MPTRSIARHSLRTTSPGIVAGRELNFAVFGDSPLGKKTTLQSIKSITLDDVKQWYKRVYRPNDALLLISGDVTVKRGKELAETLLAGWEPADQLPKADYTPVEPSKTRRIVTSNKSTTAPARSSRSTNTATAATKICRK